MRHIKRYSQLFENSQELSQEQQDWLNKCSKGTWKLNPETGLVDVEGNFNCSGKKRMTNFKGVRFGHVSGTFDCCRSSLTSLEGAPQSVGGDFICHSNSLTSLPDIAATVRRRTSCRSSSAT